MAKNNVADEGVNEERVRRVRRRFPFGRLMVGLIILALGVAYLGRNLGLWQFDFTLTWGVVWPALIILLGLSMLSGESVLSYIIGVIAVLLVVGLIVAASIPGNRMMKRVSESTGTSETQNNRSWSFSTDDREQKQEISVDKSDSTAKAEVAISTGAGTLDLAGGSDKLLSGTFESNFLQMNIDSETKNELQKVSLTAKGNGPLFGRKFNNLDLKLNSGVPMSLKLDTGAMDMNMDLKDVEVSDLDVNTGASTLNITLGDKAKTFTGTIDAGASTVELSLPKNVGSRIKIESGLTSKNLNGFKQTDNKTYETDNYSGAEKKIDLELKLGAASLTVNTY